MHAETPRLADKTIVFSEHEVFTVVVMPHGNTIILKNIFTNEKSPKNITFNYKIVNSPNKNMLGMLLYVI